MRSLLGAECSNEMRAGYVTPTAVKGQSPGGYQCRAPTALGESLQFCFAVATSRCPSRTQTWKARH